jgi:hypothetical protein
VQVKALVLLTRRSFALLVSVVAADQLARLTYATASIWLVAVVWTICIPTLVGAVWFYQVPSVWRFYEDAEAWHGSIDTAACEEILCAPVVQSAAWGVVTPPQEDELALLGAIVPRDVQREIVATSGWGSDIPLQRNNRSDPAS